MRDAGRDIRRNSRQAVALADVAKRGFLDGWLLDNQTNFIETMDLVRDGAPVQWAKLYLEAYKMGLVKEQNINININRQQDRENLQALVHARITPQLEAYTPFEEVTPTPVLDDGELAKEEDLKKRTLEILKKK